METLSSILSRNRVEVIHFLKIDVEGAERAVLSGMDLSAIRPWIILVESTIPNSPIENYLEWESLITSKDYKYVYFDGLNRYYIAEEHDDLRRHFHVPPNVFDDFIQSRIFDLEERIATTARRCSEYKLVATDAKTRSNSLLTRLGHLENTLELMRSSYSWKITAPLRLIQRAIIRLVGK
jgi:hypothetical protein